jgi:hypothetical protein
MFKFATSARVFALALLVILSATGLFAQGVGSITGVVQDPSGAVVADAKVVVDNASKGIHRELATSAAGIFNAPALVPASGYQVTVTKQGFAGYQVKEITVAVGETVSLNPVLKVNAGSTAVEVSGEAPVVDFTKTETSQVVGSDQIQELPINGRRVDSFVMLTPGVTNDGTFGLLSFRGNPGGNIFLTDGNDTTNAYYNENAGRTRSYNISQDAVQEFQVVTSNFKAEYGRASGGVVNTVTRSGGNAIHGSLYEYFRNQNLNATDVTTKNSIYPNGINPPENRHQAGLSVGGPIVKDKLFYFFNGEMMRRYAPIVSANIGSSAAGNNLFDNAGNIWAGQINPVTNKAQDVYTPCLQNVGKAGCDAVVSYLKSRVLPQLVKRWVDNNLLFGKIDYRPNEKDSFSFSSNYVDWRSPNGIQTQVSLVNGNAIGNNADSNVFDRTLRASWTRVVSPTAVNELRFGFFKDRQYDPASPSLVPSYNGVSSIVGLSVNGVSNLGYATNYPRTNPNEMRFSLSDSYSWTVGKHNLKAGVDWTNTEDDVFSMPSRFGSYTYQTLWQFAADATKVAPKAGTVGYYQSFSQYFGNPKVDFSLKEAALFLQDEWHVTPKLTITPGVRMDGSDLPKPQTCNNNFSSVYEVSYTCRIPGSGAKFAPRMGLAYAINNKTTVRAGYGLFYSRFTTATIENLLVSNGVTQQSFTYNSLSTGATANPGPTFPNYYPLDHTTPSTSATPNIVVANKNFTQPNSQQAQLTIEREIAKNTSLSVSYVWSRAAHLTQTRDDNAQDPSVAGKVGYWFLCADAACSSVSQTPFYKTGLYTARNYPTYKGEIFELMSSGNSYYNAMLVQFTRRYSNWFTGSLNYTYSHAIDDNQNGTATFGNSYVTSYNNGDFAAERGSSSLDRRHNFVANFVISPKLTNGNSWLDKTLINGWQLSGVQFLATPQYQIATVYTQDAYTGTLNPVSGYTMNGLSSVSRIPWVSTSGAANRIGNLVRTDLRLAKKFQLTERVRMDLGFEAVNVFNHRIFTARNVQKYTAEKCGTVSAAACTNTPKDPNGNQFVLVPYSGFDAVTATQITPDGTTARRAQANVRISF